VAGYYSTLSLLTRRTLGLTFWVLSSIASGCSKRFFREPIGGILSSTHATPSQAASGDFQLRLRSTDRVPSALGPNFKLRSPATIPAGASAAGSLSALSLRLLTLLSLLIPPLAMLRNAAGWEGPRVYTRRGILLTTVTVQSRDFTARLAVPVALVASGTMDQLGLGGWNGPGAQSALSPGRGPVSHGIPRRVV
jgi:hypothetical protein